MRAVDGRMRHIPVNREAPAHAYLRARRLLEEGEAVGGFPEAGISYSFTVRPLMRGFVSLAQQTGAPSCRWRSGAPSGCSPWATPSRRPT